MGGVRLNLVLGLAVLIGAVSMLGSVRATDDLINSPNLPRELYSAILEQCAPAWDPTDRNIYATDGASLNDVDRATRTAFVSLWQVDAWPRWRWEADCLRAAQADQSEQLGTPGSVRTIDDASTTLIPPPRDYVAILEQCAPAWDPADRNIYATDGASLNDVDRATRTAFVNLWQIDAWPRWRWEADCLQAAIPATVDTPVTAVGATSSPQATLNPARDSSISPSRLSIRDYRTVLDECAPVWSASDRNIYTTDGLSLNDVDRATRTAFVTVWQVDAWPRWRWEADCLRAVIPTSVDTPVASVGATSSPQATLNPARDSSVNRPRLSVRDYRTVLDECAPVWSAADRNIYTTDGLSLNDVDRATRTAFVTVWQIDAWPRWRWEADCLRARRSAPSEPSESIGSPGSVRTTVKLGDTPTLPRQVYAAILDLCTPAWDPTDRNIYTTDGASLNGEDRATRTAFVTLWQIDAWQRWRWESECLRVAFTPADDSPGGAFGLPAGAGGPPAGSGPSPAGSSGSPPGAASTPRSPRAPTQDPTTHPAFPQVVQTAVARGADDALARQIAIQVVSEERIEDFLNGNHEGVLYGEYTCTVRSAACPLVPEDVHYDAESSSDQPSFDYSRGDPSDSSSGSGTRFASYPPATRRLRELDGVGAHVGGNAQCDENGYCRPTHIIGFDRRSGRWYVCYVFDYSNPSGHLVPQDGGDHTAHTDPNQVCRRY